MSLSEKDEPALGEAVALQATNRYPIYPDENLNKYVTLVGRTVGAASAMPNVKYYFAVLDTDQVNAFSGPHGFVFITRGALAQMKDESELAALACFVQNIETTIASSSVVHALRHETRLIRSSCGKAEMRTPDFNPFNVSRAR